MHLFMNMCNLCRYARFSQAQSHIIIQLYSCRNSLDTSFLKSITPGTFLEILSVPYWLNMKLPAEKKPLQILPPIIVMMMVMMTVMVS